MPLNFPIIEDIYLANAPLQEVICQIRFPAILRIAHEEPAEFQERIRNRFPVLEIESEVVLETEKFRPIGRVGIAPPTYRFHNQENTWTVSLAPDFFALSTTDYQHWTDFADYLAYVADAAQTVYTIPYATRIGLRYINMLDTVVAGSDTFDDVLDLLRDELTAILETDVFLSPELALQRIQVTENSDQFTFRYGLIHEGTPSDDLKFVLDFDHYATGNLELGSLLARCNRYHQVIYHAFRWCIADGKLSIFQPVIASDGEV